MADDLTHDNDESLIMLAKMAQRHVERSFTGKDYYTPLHSLSGVVEALAARVAELTVELRRLKTHDAHPVEGENDYGTVCGVCACGWRTSYEEPDRVAEWITRHLDLYDR